VRDPFSDARGRAQLRIVGVGNRWRSDDAAGLVVARRLAGTVPGAEVYEHEGEPTSLIDTWEGAHALWLVDAVSANAAPGTLHRFDLATSTLPVVLFRGSTHHVSLVETVELARAVGRLPRLAVLYGIEGATFETGDRLSDQVEKAVDRAVRAIREEVEACTSRR
jgi:hydrogenase maturation protease